MIANWVSAFCKYGIDGLKPHKKGRKSKLDSPPMKNEQNKTTNEETASDAQERIRQLEDENYHLRLENAILKKRRGCGRNRKQRKKRESSVPPERIQVNRCSRVNEVSQVDI